MYADVNRTANFTPPPPPIGELNLSPHLGLNASTTDGGLGVVENLLVEQLPLHNNTFALSCLLEASCYLMNISNWLGPLEVVLPTYGIVMPCLLIFTCITNTIIILVLSRPHMRSPTNNVLLAMAVTDLLTILLPGPWYIWLYTFSGYQTKSLTSLICFMMDLFLELIPQMLHTISIWLTTVLVTQRYLYVCRAHLVAEWCTLRQSKVSIVSVMLVSFLHVLPRILDKSYAGQDSEFNGELNGVCLVKLAPWVTMINIDVYFNIFYWFRVVFVHFFPCVIVTLLTTFICIKLKKLESKRNEMVLRRRNMEKEGSSSGSSNPEKATCIPLVQRTKRKESRRHLRENRKFRDAKKTTIMLIIVIIFFLFTEIPFMVITILHTLNASLGPFLNYMAAQTIILILNIAICSTSPLNFAIYCGLSVQFRDTFRDLFLSPIQKNYTRPVEFVTRTSPKALQSRKVELTVSLPPRTSCRSNGDFRDIKCNGDTADDNLVRDDNTTNGGPSLLVTSL